MPWSIHNTLAAMPGQVWLSPEQEVLVSKGDWVVGQASLEARVDGAWAECLLSRSELDKASRGEKLRGVVCLGAWQAGC